MKNKQSVPVLIPFLILISMLFIGILIFAYVETKKANPKMIEVGQVGKPLPYGRGPDRAVLSLSEPRS
jgi:hypothetical protein